MKNMPCASGFIALLAGLDLTAGAATAGQGTDADDGKPQADAPARQLRAVIG